MSTNRRIVEDVIYESNYLSYGELIDTIKRVPEEYRNTIELRAIEKYFPYEDTPSKILLITYKRPENDEEYSKRLEEEKIRDTRLRERELETLKQLKAKYGDTV